jgi:hypothetical protein
VVDRCRAVPRTTGGRNCQNTPHIRIRNENTVRGHFIYNTSAREAEYNLTHRCVVQPLQEIPSGCAQRAAAGKPFVLSHLEVGSAPASSAESSTEVETLSDLMRNTSISSTASGGSSGTRDGHNRFNLVFR